MIKALIVDDEKIILNGLIHLIDWGKLGIEIVDALTDSQLALQVLQTKSLDLLITDVNMPNVSGIDLIKAIRASELNIKVIVISGYDDFSYVRQCFLLGVENYLLKPVDELELSKLLEDISGNILQKRNTLKLLENDIDKVKKHVLHRLIIGNLHDDEMKSILTRVGIPLDKDTYVVATSVIYGKDNLLEHINEIMKEIEDFFSELAEDSNKAALKISIECLHTASNEISVLFMYNKKEIKSTAEIRNDLNKVWAKIIERHPVTHFTAIGSVQNNLHSLADSYTDAKKMSSYDLIMPKNSVINYSSMQKLETDFIQRLNLNLQQLDDLLIKENDDKINQIIGNIFAKIRACSEITPYECKRIITEMIFHLFGTLGMLGIPIDQSDMDQSLLFNILNLPTLDAMQDELTEIALRYWKVHNTNVHSHPTITKILKYINQHYYEEISVKTITELFYINPKYLGQLFKQQTGYYFTDYLSNVRIEKAKELLVNTNLKSYDIAMKVGFTDSSYFANVFKKKVGVYPTKYRADHVKGN